MLCMCINIGVSLVSVCCCLYLFHSFSLCFVLFFSFFFVCSLFCRISLSFCSQFFNFRFSHNLRFLTIFRNCLLVLSLFVDFSSQFIRQFCFFTGCFAAVYHLASMHNINVHVLFVGKCTRRSSYMDQDNANVSKLYTRCEEYHTDNWGAVNDTARW